MKNALFACALLLLVQIDSAWAAEAVAGQQAQEETNSASQTDDESEQNVLPENEEAEVEDDPDSSPSRVIPTEQISQDLGVSFPVDI